MGRSNYPFRDPNRPRPDDNAGNRRDENYGNRRDENLGNRRDENLGNRRDEPGGNRRDEGNPRRPERLERQERQERQERSAARRIEGAAGSTSLRDLTADLAELLQLLNDTDISELQIERGDLKVTIRRGSPVVHSPPFAAAPGVQAVPLGSRLLTPEARPATQPEPAADQEAGLTPTGHAAPLLGEREHLLVAPMVGTFYAASSPQAPPFVVEGDLVEPGQTVGIIEAMKIMNEIEAESAGRVVRVLARDGQGVEYGQPLMVIEEV